MSASCHQIQITTSTSSPASSPSSSSSYSKSFDQLSISSSRLRLSLSPSINHQRCGILLRSSDSTTQFSRLWTIGSLGRGAGGGGGGGVFIRSDDGEPQVNDHHHHRSFVFGEEERIGDVLENNSRYDLTKDEEEEEKEGTTASCGGDRDRGRDEHDRRVEVLVAAAATVVLGVGNRVLYKLALVPLKHYPFFLAQIATFGYVLVYFSVLYFRYHAGIVTDEMLSLPKAPFLCVGLLEALAAASGMAAAAILSGESIPILSQTFLVWQLLLSALFLGRRYRINQIFGCFLVAIGVIITVASGSGAGLSLKGAGIFWTLLMITSFFLQAADTVLKEIIFLRAAQKLKGGSVDLFVVNSYGSAFQALFICLLLPFLSKLWGVPFSQLPAYLKDGAACFLDIGTLSKGCEGAPLLPLLFVMVNMAYNISLLHLLKISSAVVSCLASTFSVPLSVFAFTLPLPYIGVASSLPAGFVMGTIVLIIGLLFYSWTPTVGPNTFTTTSTSINRKTN